MEPKKVEKKELGPTERMYDIILRPIITEKATLVAQEGKVVFAVRADATKKDVKDAIEAIYKVEVKSVNVSIRPGKDRRFKGVKGRTGDTKKAYVTLKEGHNIDIMAPVK